jgi:uncharacterized membrane protein YedE/YeeE
LLLAASCCFNFIIIVEAILGRVEKQSLLIAMPCYFWRLAGWLVSSMAAQNTAGHQRTSQQQ